MGWVRQLVVVTAVGVAAATATVVPAGSAGAGAAVSSPFRVESRSDLDDTPVKQAIATCPRGRLFAAGALVIGGEGGVVLTAIEPDDDLSAVTVEAAALAKHAGEWEVVAFAVCDTSTVPMTLVAGSMDSSTSASAACPGDRLLVGFGFRIFGPVAATHLVALEPSADLTRVHVRTGGAAPTKLTAYGTCLGGGASWDQDEASSPVDGVWPKVVEVGDASMCDEYGTGGAVDARHGFLTGLVPRSDKARAWVRAEVATGATVPGRAALDQDEEDGDGSVTGSVIEIGTPYC